MEVVCVPKGFAFMLRGLGEVPSMALFLPCVGPEKWPSELHCAFNQLCCGIADKAEDEQWNALQSYPALWSQSSGVAESQGSHGRQDVSATAR
eukprot:11496561-Alexandrium_andersonii.AAC.1